MHGPPTLGGACGGWATQKQHSTPSAHCAPSGGNFPCRRGRLLQVAGSSMRAGRRADCSCDRIPALQAGRERVNHRTLCSIRKKPPRPGDAPRRWEQPAPQTSRVALAKSKTTHPPHHVQHQGERSSPRARRFQVTGRFSLRTIRRNTPRRPTHRWQLAGDLPREACFPHPVWS